MSFTWFNINAGYNNQLIGYSKDSGSSILPIFHFQQVFGIILI